MPDTPAVRSRYQARDGRGSSSNSHGADRRSGRPGNPGDRAAFRNAACSTHGLLVVAMISALFAVSIGLVSYFDGVLPAPRGVDTPAAEYSEGRARRHLDNIVGFGVRTVGSVANEIETVDYLLQEVAELQSEADTVSKERASNHNDPTHAPLKVLVDVHRPSGAFSSDFLEGFTNIYHNVSNVVVLIEGTAPPSEQRSVLVNAHFDTALGTPAASDDAVMIASMLELIKNLIHGPRLRHSVIFNMNGAEETNWMAAHGFITQHRWKHKIRAMVNLEGAGAGGRELIIQTGPSHSWVAQAYARHAPWPHGHTLAQNVFQSGVIPGDTDFQVYRDYGGKVIEDIDVLPGIDLVAISKGHVYHTVLDDVAHIDHGSLQRTGENVLAVLHALGNSKHLADPGPEADEEVVFFDVLGVWMVVYTERAAFLLNITVLSTLAIVLLFSPATKNKWRLIKSIAGAVLSFLGGIAGCLAVALVLTALDQPMKWYAHPRAGYALFFAIVVYSALAVRAVLHPYVAERFVKEHAPHPLIDAGRDEEERGRESSTDEYPFFGSLGLWGLLLAYSMHSGVESAYVCVIVIASPLAARFLALALDYGSGRAVGRSSLRRTALVVLGLVLPTVLLAQYVLELAQFIFPLMGRIGTGVPPDVGVALVFGSVVSLLVQTPLSLIHEASSPRLHRRIIQGLTLLIGVQLVYLCVVMECYDAAHPKRMFYQHTRREFFNGTTLNQIHRDCAATSSSECSRQPTHSDSGFFINGIDFLNLRYFAAERIYGRADAGSSVKAIANADALPCNDETGMLCSMPFYFPIDKMVQGGIYIPAPDPTPAIQAQTMPVGPQAPLGVQVTGVRTIESDAALKRTFSLKIEGPDHLVMVVRANTLGSPAAAEAAGTDMSILGGGRTHRHGGSTPQYSKSFWALDDWSFGKNEYFDGAHTQHYDSPASPMYRPDCNCYFIFRGSGENHHESWQFDLTFVKNVSPNDKSADEEAVIDIVAYGQLLEAHSPKMDEFVANMPDWTTPVSWVSHWQQHYLDLLDIEGLE